MNQETKPSITAINEIEQLPQLKSSGLLQNYSNESWPTVSGIPQYPTRPVSLPNSPLEVVIVENKNHGVFYRVSEHHYNLVYGCTVGQWTSNSTYNKLYLNLLIHDYKVLINGHEAFDKMMFLEEEGLPIKATLLSIHGAEAFERIERNITALKLSLIAIGCFLLFGLFGFVDGVMDMVLAENLTSLLILSVLSKGFFLLVCGFYYISYGYHNYATLLDRFVSKREYFTALRQMDVEAWFPFLYQGSE
ncbi:hypothetical protein [Vibrio vulnificus]|uniref:hypothetical protein n=1 Tax=Vibrio vulnificus TaxID=672 RepID=UPI001A1AEA8C|nr:hypothetical protein [Vibrio vulnificus]HAS6035796.1 hypothetical protein [Vibrio vulnificus]HDY7428889.1 hypothetical protein [Vibrio vulnificus]HDY7488556.1 hypothetical protein [Vibrio vulnificus]HDY7951685.1 hypothetical protein [Vibrio vulnificus]